MKKRKEKGFEFTDSNINSRKKKKNWVRLRGDSKKNYFLSFFIF
jgi:hypothetical protein